MPRSKPATGHLRVPVLVTAATLFFACALTGQTISTVAGGLVVNKQPALSTPLADPHGAALDAQGNLIVLDTGNGVIRKVDAVTGISTIIAGGGARLDDSLPIAALTASIPSPLFAAVDKAGNLLFSDLSYRIRKVSPQGFVTTVVGNGRFGYSGDGGPASFAEIGPPYGMAFDASGNLFFADCYNAVIRKVDAITGIIRTVVGNSSFGFSGDGGPATRAQLSCPAGLSFDSRGNLYFVDANNYRLRRVDTQGVITTVAGNGMNSLAPDGVPASTNIPLAAPIDIAVDQAGNIYLSEGAGRVRRIVASSGVLSTLAGGGTSTLDGIPGNRAFVGRPWQLFVDRAGNVYFADHGRNAIRRVDAVSGIISTLAGTDNVFDGNTALSVVLANPIKLALDRAGNLLVVDQTHNRVRKVDAATGVVTTVAGTGQPGFDGEGGVATAALLQFPAGITTSAAGDIYISDTFNHRIRKVDGRTGTVSTVAGTGAVGSTGDGGPATRATLQSPDGLLLDSGGNLYIADAGNGLVRGVDAFTGVISTVAGNRSYAYSGDGGPATAASLFNPTDLAFDNVGNLLIVDRGTHTVRKVDRRTNVISTVAGTGVSGYSGDNGPATLARLSSPSALVVNPSGDLFVADCDNHAIRKVSADSGIITTVVGTGRVGFSGDGGLAGIASLSWPEGLAVDAAANLYISDTGNNRIRKVTPARIAPALGVAPAILSFSALQGGASPDPQTFYALNTNFVGLSWSLQVAGTGASWLKATPGSGVAPSAITVSVNPSGLVAGDYRATLVVSSPGAVGSPQTVSVLLTVTPAAQASVALSTQLLSFQAVAGGISPSPQTLSIVNAGSGTLQWSASAQTSTGGSWLALSAPSGTAPSSLFVSINTRGLSAGVYQGTVTVQGSSGGAAVNATVVLTVTGPASAILLSQTGFQFTAVEGAAALPPQKFAVLNAGQGSMNWSAEASTTSGGGWLQASPQTGASDSSGLANSPAVTVSANAAGLKAGTYSGLIVISASGAVNSPQLVTVVLRVLSPGSAPPPQLEPAGLLFVLMAGSGMPAVQALSLFNPGPALGFAAAVALTAGADWLSVTPASGTLQGVGSLGVQVNPGGLSAGVYRATITLAFSNGNVLDAAVLLVIASGTVSSARSGYATETCTPKEQHLLATTVANSFTLAAGWPVPIVAQVVTNCGSPVIGAAVTVSFDNGDPTLVLANLGTGSYSGTWTPQRAGNVTLTVRAAYPTFQPVMLQLRGSLGATSAPQLAALGVVNAASYRRFLPLAPGSIISVFGSSLAQGQNLSSSVPLPRVLGGLSLKLGQLDVPLFYAGSSQVNAQIPFEVQGSATLPLLASLGGALTSPVPVTIAAVQPGIFTANQSGAGQGSVTNAAGILADASAPVSRGEVVVIYCTGLGATDPPVASGVATPATPLSWVKRTVTARIGGLDAPVQFAGLAPGFVGLYQVNAMIPAGVAPGNSVSLALIQDGLESNTVTIAVK
jgi:uncharacterized protein (TIGR03437 family)